MSAPGLPYPAHWTDAEVSFAQKIERLESELRLSRATCDEYLAEIKAIHREGGDPCDECLGMGEVEEIVACDSPSLSDPMQPAEQAEMIVCGRCRGTKMEWIT